MSSAACKPQIVDVERWQHIKRIVDDALELEPARRASFVQQACGDDVELRAHIESLLGVHASPEIVGYGMSEFVGRHRVGVAAAAVVALALVCGFAVALQQAQVATAERAKAVQRFKHVREFARSVLFEYHDRIAALPGAADARRRLVQDALKYLDQLSKNAGGDPDLLRELAEGYERVASIQGGSYHGANGSTAAGHLGDTAGAETSQQKAIAIREELAKASGSQPHRLALANAYYALGALYLGSAQPEEAAQYLQNAAAILETMLTPDASQEVRSRLATVYHATGKAYGNPDGPNLGDTRSALSYTRSALQLQERLAAEHPGHVEHQQALVAIHNALGGLYSAMGEPEEEVEQKRKAVEIARKIIAAQPANEGGE